MFKPNSHELFAMLADFPDEAREVFLSRVNTLFEESNARSVTEQEEILQSAIVIDHVIKQNSLEQ